MPFTVQDVDERVTDALRDVRSTKRWGPTERRNHMADGVREIKRRRPYSTYTTSINTAATALPTSDTAPVGLSDNYLPALVAYVCWKCLSKDSEDVNNANKANLFAQQFAALL